MKRLTTLSLLFLLLLSACSKKNDDRPEPVKYGPLTDFLYIPTKDAVWKIHTQGVHVGWEIIYPGQQPYSYDTSVHAYYEMRTTGIDTIISTYVYHKYIYDREIIFNKYPEGNWSQKGIVVYLRADMVTEKVYMFEYANPLTESVIVDFSIGEIGDRTLGSDHTPVARVSDIDSLLINRQWAKSWHATYDHDKFSSFFYKAYGVGTQTGFLHKYEVWDGAQPVSLDFTYKNDHKHFDFHFNP